MRWILLEQIKTLILIKCIGLLKERLKRLMKDLPRVVFEQELKKQLRKAD